MINYNKRTFFIVITIIVMVIIICSFMIINKNAENVRNEAKETKKEIENVVNNDVKEEIKKNQNEIIIEEEEIVMEDNEETLQTDLPSSYEGFTVSGEIRIPKTGVDLYVFDKQTVKGMEIAACILYSTSDLNEIGNTVITGHNYRNGKLFSNNGKLEIGDKIYIKDIEGKELEYTVYDAFMTTPEDASFYMRVCEVPEITLSTCSDDEESRIITLAKCEN